MNKKEKEEFEKFCKSTSKADKVPLYTFRCHKCKYIFLMSEQGGNVLAKINNKLDTPVVCKHCWSFYTKKN